MAKWEWAQHKRGDLWETREETREGLGLQKQLRQMSLLISALSIPLLLAPAILPNLSSLNTASLFATLHTFVPFPEICSANIYKLKWSRNWDLSSEMISKRSFPGWWSTRYLHDCCRLIVAPQCDSKIFTPIPNSHTHSAALSGAGERTCMW